MTTQLVALDGGPDITVGPALVIVGRDRRCDARLGSIRVSRLHCCLAEIDGRVLVRDLGSTNGILINGLSVSAGLLGPGDELSIAHLRYRAERPPPPQLPSPSELSSVHG
jgi:pSer/pThr/pTyr-binding forkhead associated (FHA) protein